MPPGFRVLGFRDPIDSHNLSFSMTLGTTRFSVKPGMVQIISKQHILSGGSWDLATRLTHTVAMVIKKYSYR